MRLSGKHLRRCTEVVTLVHFSTKHFKRLHTGRVRRVTFEKLLRAKQSSEGRLENKTTLKEEPKTLAL